uniref:Uncharacterized protein n=1 Tax=Cebus imitator TaxID=2715852 RepID=A0A2K5PT05_CEBIM
TVRVGATIMIVLILLRVARQAPAQAQFSDRVRHLFLLGLGAPRVGTWSSPDEDRRPRKPVLGTGDRDPGTRRRRQDVLEQDPRPGNDSVASPEIAEPPSPAGIRAQDRAPRHRSAPPARMPVAPAPSADGGERQLGWGAGGRRTLAPHQHPSPRAAAGTRRRPFHCTRSVHNWLELNTWMKVERLLVETFHQSFSLDR